MTQRTLKCPPVPVLLGCLLASCTLMTQRENGMESKPNACVVPNTVICLLASCFIWIAPGCTISRQENAGENSQPHTSVQPAVVVGILSAVDGQFSDRAQDDGTSASGDVAAEQTATSTPTLNVPTGVPAVSNASLPTTEEEIQE